MTRGKAELNLRKNLIFLYGKKAGDSPEGQEKPIGLHTKFLLHLSDIDQN
jgi:hypothetical protein